MSHANKSYNVGFIGVGIMGEALLSALIKSGYPAEKINFFEKREERAAEISKKYQVKELGLTNLASQSDLLLLATKPQDLGSLLDEINTHLKSDVTLISFAAGKTIDFISNRTKGSKVIRVMPNTPVLLNKGMSAISVGPGVDSNVLEFTENFLSSCGKAIVIAENLQDAVTATSGSGPAYFFAFVEEMIKSSIALGLSEKEATALTIQTIVGAAAMLEESGKSPTMLRENVTSPNGTTAAALNKFSEAKLGEIISTAMKAARDRSQELA